MICSIVIDDERDLISHKLKNVITKEWICLPSDEGISINEMWFTWLNNWARSSLSEINGLSWRETQRLSLVGKMDLFDSLSK